MPKVGAEGERTRIVIHHPRAAECAVHVSEDWGIAHAVRPVDARASAFEVAAKRSAEFKVTLGNEWAIGPNAVLKGKEIHVAPTFTRGAGRVETLFHGFYSHALDNKRDIRVYLPPGYGENPARRYPVVYFHDGQNVFSGHGPQPHGTWAAERALDHLIGTGRIAPVIAIGIDNLGDRRMAEYGPEQGRKYVRFVAHELKPEVDKHLRTLADPRHVAVVGSSLGAWISLYGAHKEPRLGNKVAGLSGAAWFRGDTLPRMVESGELEVAPFKAPDARVWLDYGTLAKDPLDLTDDVDGGRGNRRLWAAYAAKGLNNERPGFKTSVIPFSEGEVPHSEPSWAKRLGDVLAFILEPWNGEG